ncbi:MAG: hypothetical protein NDJ92_17540 [Thermoanaerobaculia bacterium]|nr:hypothetical protein [Thermoanaerobaculia bacterium]
MKSPRVVISDVIPATFPTLVACDMRVELADGLTLVLRDVRYLEASSGGRFVGLPRKQRSDAFVRTVDFEGPVGAVILEAIREAMKQQLATSMELEAAATGGDDVPF